MQTLFVDSVTAEVTRALRAAGVGPILLKGPVLEAWTPVEDKPRTYDDTDLLVAPGDLARAEAVLAELGFTRLLRPDEAPGGPDTGVHWTRAADAANVDMHVTLTGLGVAPEGAWQVLSARTAGLTVAGEEVRCLDDAGRALHVALHAAQHGLQLAAPLRDLRAAIASLDERVWRAAAAQARELEAEGAFAAGLRLEPSGVALAAALGLGEQMDVQTALRAGIPPPLSLGIDEILRLPTRRGQLRRVVRELFPSPAFMRRWSPLARRGVAGLVLAYLWRPLWILSRLPAASRAYRRARRVNARSG